MDVGTGTGVWPLAIAALHPQWHCMGTDVSSDQFPPLESLGPNVKLQVSDLRESFPKAMLGHFDVVHARLLLLAMEDQHAWTVAVNNLSTLLKPGGWLQWEEANVNALGEVLRDRRNREQSASAMRRGFKRLEEIAGQRMVDVPQKLGKAFQAACLEDIEMDTVASDRLPESGRPTGTRMGIGVFEGVLKQRREVCGCWNGRALFETLYVGPDLNADTLCDRLRSKVVHHRWTVTPTMTIR